MKKFVIYLCMLFSTVSCKNDTEIKKKIGTIVKSRIGIQKDLICDEVLKKIVKSSCLDFKNYINYFIRIEEVKGCFITAQVYLQNNLSDNPRELQIVESTIARLSFDPIKAKLYNITADQENPIELNFDKNIVMESAIFDSYKITKNHKKVSETSSKFSVLSEKFNENYGKNIHQSHILESNNYPKYSFTSGDTLPVGLGKNLQSNNYLYLQKVNKNRSKIASNSSSDTEPYTVIVIRDNKIISTLEIDLKNKESLNQLDVKKDDIINLKRKDISNKNPKWESYRINSDGKMVKLQ